MFKEMIKVFGETIVYGFTGVASVMASILLVPFYTRVLTPGEIGGSTLITTLFSILFVIANAGMSSAIFRVYFRADKEERATVAGTSFISQTVFPFVLSVITFLLSGTISSALFGDENWAFLVQLSAVTLFFNVGIMVPLALLRAEGHPAAYVRINIIRLLATVGFSILLVVALRWGLLGVFWANLIAALIGYLFGLGYVFRRIKLVFSSYWMIEMIKFGLPLVPAGLAMWVLNSSDKYFLNYFVGAEEVGIYSVGYRFGALVTLVSGAIQLASPRFVYSIYEQKLNAEVYFKRLTTYFFIIMFSSAFITSIFAREAIMVLMGNSFQRAYIVVPFIAFSYVAYSLYYNFSIGVSVTGKTYFSAFAVFIGGVINIGLNLLLISSFGMLGAALATLFSFIALALVQLLFSQKVYRIPFEFARMLTIVVLGSSLIGISSLINLSLIPSLVLKSLLVLLFPIFLYAFGFFDEAEVEKLKLLWQIVISSKGSPAALRDSVKQTFFP